MISALLLTSIVWIRKTRVNFNGVFLGTGKSLAAFGALSFIALP